MKKIIKEEGFSLLEVSVAVGIMALLTAIAVPAFTGMIPTTQARVDAQVERNCNVETKVNELVALANEEEVAAAECVNVSPSPAG
jgi:prepilin-type N-terminal cleavage/methylation domain-containing protein